MRPLMPACLLLSLVACGPSVTGGGDDDDTLIDARVDSPTGGACTPGVNVCVGTEVHACLPDGTVGPSPLQNCAPMTCVAGQCMTGGGATTCADAEASRSYLGCEYWPVDLDNAVEVNGTEFFPGLGCPDPAGGAGFVPAVSMPVCAQGGVLAGLCDYGMSCADSPGNTCQTMNICVLNAQKSPFAVVVSNPQPTAVSVTLTSATGQTATDMVAPGQVKALFPQMMGLADQSLDFSGIEAKAYKLVSSAPIVAYQFNPLDNVGVFSNDASLLIPAHAYDLDYTGVSYKTLVRRPLKNDYNGYVTVVASGPGTTTVMVRPTAGVRAGLNVPAIAAGATQSFTLNQFQTLTLEAVGNGDLTGTAITCSQACGAFGGHEATNLTNQAQSPCCADHLEDQLFPNSTWGKVYVVAHSKTRASPVPDLVRVIAQRPNTTVTFNPPQPGCAAALAAGAYCDVFTSADVEISANEPIQVAHYLLSNIQTDTDVGDPSMAFAVPTEQYRSTYTLLVPQQYQENILSIVTPAGSTVRLDGTDISGQLAAFGGGTYKAGRVTVGAGPHTLDCPGTCGVEVYGWSEAVSYMFAGGLDLEQIVIGRTAVTAPVREAVTP
ncbi:MAG: IgGFc-binding protein [Myxococcales bacterium]|nr:IgGFc-binding protein [Myxococcales bacterium]